MMPDVWRSWDRLHVRATRRVAFPGVSAGCLAEGSLAQLSPLCASAPLRDRLSWIHSPWHDFGTGVVGEVVADVVGVLC